MPWSLAYDILITPWDPNLYLYRQPTFGYCLDIIVTGFPVPLWHEFFIVRLLSFLGEIVFINAENLLGIDKSCIAASIWCFDTRTVPPSLSKFTSHNTGHAECRIKIRQWDGMPHIPLRIRPYPNFADPNDRNGDDYTEAHNRGHATSCHDI